jgi:hypothetical protein
MAAFHSAMQCRYRGIAAGFRIASAAAKNRYFCNGLTADLRCIVRERPLPFVSLEILSDSETPSGVATQRPRKVRALFGLDRSRAARRCHGRVRG